MLDATAARTPGSTSFPRRTRHHDRASRRPVIGRVDRGFAWIQTEPVCWESLERLSDEDRELLADRTSAEGQTQAEIAEVL